MRSSLVVRSIYSKQPKEKLGHKEQVNFVKYPILNRAQKRDIVNVSKGNTVYIMLPSIVFCVDARCSATGTSRSAVFFCLESGTIITGQTEICQLYIVFNFSINTIYCVHLPFSTFSIRSSSVGSPDFSSCSRRLMIASNLAPIFLLIRVAVLSVSSSPLSAVAKSIFIENMY